MVIQGYVLNTTDLSEINKKISEIRQKINREAGKIYDRLIGEEAAFLCDKVVTGVLKKDKGVPIIKNAAENVAVMIDRAGAAGLKSRYNFNIFCHVIPYDGKTYLKVTCDNEELLKAFKGLEECSVDEDEAKDTRNGKTMLWMKIHKECEKNEPPVVRLNPIPELKKENIKYPTVPERARTLARENLTNLYLNRLSGGGQIPPFLLVKYMDIAMSMLLSAEGKEELSRRTAELTACLPDLGADDSVVFSADDAVIKDKEDG